MTTEELDRFVDAFIARERKARWRSLLHSPKGRVRLTRTFAHGYDFKPRSATQLGRGTTFEEVVAILRAKGAGRTVYAMSEDSELDGGTLPLEEAVAKVLGAGFGAYLVCDPARLAFFESEDVGGHFVLERPASISSCP